MRRLLLTVVILLVVSAGSLTAWQAWAAPFASTRDHVLPPSPCAYTVSAAPVVYGDIFWVLYTCGDGITVLREFVPMPGTVPPAPVAPTPTAGCVTVQPGPSWVCRNGGWSPQ